MNRNKQWGDDGKYCAETSDGGAGETEYYFLYLLIVPERHIRIRVIRDKLNYIHHNLSGGLLIFI